MFGLSTQEVEMKNVLAAYKNCLVIYYEGIRLYALMNKYPSEESLNKEIENLTREYFNASKDSLFSYLRTQYKDFDIKFENALKCETDFVGNELIDKYKKNGFTAGVLFYYVYYAIKQKFPNIMNCTDLSHKVNGMMDQVLVLVNQELHN